MTIASKEAFQDVLLKMPQRRGDVYGVIYKNRFTGMTLRDLGRIIPWPMNCISPRVFDLADAGHIKDAGEMRDGQTVWIPADASERIDLIASRQRAKGKTAEIVASTTFHFEQSTYITVKLPGKVDKYKVGQKVKLS